MTWKGVDPEKWAVTAMEKSEDAIRATAIKYFSAIVTSSPVDEGTFRANWYVTTTSPSSDRNDSKTDKSGSSTISAMANFVSKSITWDSFIFTNNLPYSEVIEFGGYSSPVSKGTWNKKTKSYEERSLDGYSKLAPQGVVRVNAIRFNKLLEAEARKVN